MGIESNIWKYNLVEFLKNFNIVLPIFFLFFQSNGLSVTQIMLLFSISAIGLILFEVPSGIFADYFGRKTTISLGVFIFGFTYLIIALSSSFWYFVLAYTIAFIGLSLISGADTAFLFDTLKTMKKEGQFTKVLGRAHTFSNLGFAAGALVGGVVSQFGFRTNYYLFSLSIFIAFFVTLSYQEPKVYQKIDVHYLTHFKESLSFVVKHVQVRWLIVFNGIMLGSMYVIFGLWQPYLVALGIPVSSFGYLYTFFLLTASFVSFYAHAIKNKIGGRMSFILIPLLISLPLILMSKFLFLFSLVFMTLVEFAFGYTAPVIGDYIHQHVESRRRATVMSMNSLFFRICWAAIGPLVGYFVDLYSLETALWSYAVILLVVSALVLVPLLKAHPRTGLRV